MLIGVFGVEFAEWANYVKDLVDLLDEAEIEESSRRRRRALAEHYVISHAALRMVIAFELGSDPVGLRFKRDACRHCGDEHGAPRLRGQELQFSLSRTDDVALIAISSRAVGIDVERHRPVTITEGVVAQIASLDERDRHDGSTSGFFDWWVRKEAVVKATGEGLMAASKYSFASREPSGWRVPLLDAGLRHSAAVAIGARDPLAESPTIEWLAPTSRLRLAEKRRHRQLGPASRVAAGVMRVEPAEREPVVDRADRSSAVAVTARGPRTT